MILPLGFALYASFFNYQLGQESRMAFVFLGNYVGFFADPVALRSLFNTVVFTLLSLAFGITIGVGVSVLLKNTDPRAANFLRAIFAMPVLISPIIVSLIWRYMYAIRPSASSISFWIISASAVFPGLSEFLHGADLHCHHRRLAHDAIHHPRGLGGAHGDSRRALRGRLTSTAPRLCRRCSGSRFPCLPRCWSSCCSFAASDAFRTFDLVYGLTGGGPANSTTSLSIYAYQQAFEDNHMGFGMAASIITLVCLVALFGPLLRNSARRDEE